ncbi:MAG: SufE family protein [Alphaproteobacteria bacterium]|nr:SufE family protein [Alphaproteobacteria bacterium]
MDIAELIDNFELLDGWEEKYAYIIELGSHLEPLDEEYRTEEWKVRGCQSQVWLEPKRENDKIYFKGDSDAFIVKGLIAIVLMIYSNKSAQEIKEIEVEKIFAKLGLQEHLSPSRRNGLFSMVEKIKYYADVLS